MGVEGTEEEEKSELPIVVACPEAWEEWCPGAKDEDEEDENGEEEDNPGVLGVTDAPPVEEEEEEEAGGRIIAARAELGETRIG